MMRGDWKEVELLELGKGKNAIVDGPFGSNLKTSDYIDDLENGVPVLTTRNLSGDYSKNSVRYISKIKFEELKRSQVLPGDIIVAKIGSIGKTGVYPKGFPIAIIPANLLKFTLTDSVIFKYVYSFLNYEGFQNQIRSIATATAQPAFNVTKFRRLKIPLAPLPEQRAIVAKIEKLFSDIDNGVANLKAAKDKLEIYRQAVLKKAFEGELTKPHEITWITLDEICDDVQYGTSSKSLELGEIPVIRMGNIQNGKLDWSDLVYTSDKNEIEKYKLNYNDVLFNRTNSPELVGKTAIYKGEFPAIFAGYLIRINYKKSEVNPDYLTYFLNCHIAKKYGNKIKSDGVNQSNINGTKLKQYPFPKTKLEVQKQIVAEIETRLSVCDNILATIDEALEKSEALRQSVLKKAFEGRLLSEAELEACRKEADWEPAEKLLERIKVEKEAGNGK